MIAPQTTAAPEHAAGQLQTVAEAPSRGRITRWLKRAGLAYLIFCTIKGLLWLAAASFLVSAWR